MGAAVFGDFGSGSPRFGPRMGHDEHGGTWRTRSEEARLQALRKAGATGSPPVLVDPTDSPTVLLSASKEASPQRRRRRSPRTSTGRLEGPSGTSADAPINESGRPAAARLVGQCRYRSLMGG